MKKQIKIASFVLVMMAFTSTVSAQSTAEKKSTPPSDMSTGYTYDFDKALNLIVSRVENPQKENAIVQPFLETTDFPAVSKNRTVDTNSKNLIRAWMEKNPALIINTLKSRTDIVTPY